MRASGVALIVVAALACTATATAGPGDPKRVILADDQKHAEAMLIRQGDVPRGFTATTSAIPGLPYCAALDESDLTVSGEAMSPSFWLDVRPGAARYSVQAQARVFRSTADALASWRRRTSPAGERCFRIALAAAMLKDGVVFRSLTRIRIPKVAPRTIAYSIESTIKGSDGRQHPVPWQLIRMQSRRGEVTLWRSGPTANAPVPLAHLARTGARYLANAPP